MFEHFWLPILAHGGDDTNMSMTELLISVGLLVLSGALATALFAAIFLKPVLRVRKQWKEGRLPASSKLTYLIVSLMFIFGFMFIAWRFAWAVYYDYHFEKWEQAQVTQGKHERGGAEYKWNRWHIYGKYLAPKLILYVDDVLEKADPKTELTVQARTTSPVSGDWKKMAWDPKQKAFIGEFKADGQKMEFQFELSAGWSTYSDEIIGYVPRQLLGKDADIADVPPMNMK